MKNLLCFIVVLCFLSCALLSEESGTWKFYVKKIVVKDTKPNKDKWDVDLGKKSALPDIYFTVSKENQRRWKEFFKSPVMQDSLVYDKLFNTKAEVKIGDKIKIDVWDKDLGRHDLIGSWTFTIQIENLVESKENDMPLGSALSFVYFFSQYSSSEEKAAAFKETELNQREAALALKEKQWEEEKAKWDQEREGARNSLTQIQQEWNQEKARLVEEWNQKEQGYVSEIQTLKENFLEKTIQIEEANKPEEKTVPEAKEKNLDQVREEAREKLAQIQQEWNQEKARLVEEWSQKEQGYVSEIQTLKENLLEKTAQNVKVEEKTVPEAKEGNLDQVREEAREKLAQIQQEWNQEKAKLVEEWNQKEQGYVSEIQKLKENLLEKTAQKVEVEEKTVPEAEEVKSLLPSPGLSPERLEKIHSKVDRSVTKIRSAFYHEMKSVPYVKESLDVYQGIVGTFLK